MEGPSVSMDVTRMENKVDNSAAGCSEAKVLKLWSSNRDVRKGTIASKYEDLLMKGKNKFNIANDVHVRYVLEQDGTEIDNDYFGCLPCNTELMILKEGEEWTDANSTKTDQVGIDSGATAGEMPKLTKRVFDIVKNLRKRNERAKAQQSTKRQKTETTVRVGWQHFHFSDRKFRLVRSTRSHPKYGPRNLPLENSNSYKDTLDLLKDEFFPSGKNFKGKLKHMQCDLGNSQGEVILAAEFKDILHFTTQCPSQKPSLYLLTKEKNPFLISDSCTSSSDELPDLDFLEEPQRNTSENSVVPAAAGAPSELQSPLSHTPTHDQYFNLTAVSTGEMNTSVSSGQVNMMDAGTPTVEMKLPTQNPPLCTVCFDRRRDSFLVPCGHSFCTVCSVQLEASRQTCPICRGGILKVSNIFNI